MKIEIRRLSTSATLPSYAHASDAGMDIYCSREVELAPGEQTMIPTGIALQVPDGYVALVWDKSGIAAKRSIKTMGGVIDAGYRGEVMIIAKNVGSEAQIFSVGDKVAQILIQKVEQPRIVEVAELGDSDRGEKGFGSTGR